MLLCMMILYISPPIKIKTIIIIYYSVQFEGNKIMININLELLY